MRKLIKVTQEDIDEGIAYDCNECPVALAIKRAFKNIAVLWVGTYGIQVIFWSGKSFNRDTPILIRDFILAFDRKGKKAVKPTEFELIYELH